MALSEEERRRLELLEEQLAFTDPDLVRTLQSVGQGKRSREAAPMVRGILTMIAGFTLVIVAIATELIMVGAVGFVLMMAGAHWFVKGLGLRPGPEETHSQT